MTTTAAPAVPPAARTVDTHCPYCALQCAQTAETLPDGLAAERGGPIHVVGRDFPTNRGGMCQKGWTSPRVLAAPDRLCTPLVRTGDGELRAATWDEALDRTARGVREIWRRAGRSGVAVFGGGGLTNEKAYTLGKFARTVLGTPYVDYNGRFCMASAAAGANAVLGIDRGLPFPLADLGGAQAVLLLGSNLAETMPPALAHLTGARARGGLIVSDPRHTPTAALCDDGGGRHLQAVPGTDLELVLGLAHLVLARGWHDAAYLAERTTGLDQLERAVAAWWPERVEAVTGVPREHLERAARLLADASPARGGTGAYVLTGRGVEQSTRGTATVVAAIDLALLLGLPGRVGSGYGAITGQGNGQGGREHGQKADQLPGYRSIEDDSARAHVAAVWGVDPANLPRSGLPAVDLLRRLGTPTGPRALFVHGSNVAICSPRADRVAERLRALDLLVVCDVVPSETALLADVVLPVTQWAEEEGTMTSLEGRVLRRRRVLAPPPGVRSELDVWADLARRLGSPVAFATDPSDVFDELARASAGGRADYSGLSHARLDEGEALYWPCPAVGPDGGTDGEAGDGPGSGPDGEPRHPGTPRLFLDRFAHPDGRARLTVPPVAAGDAPVSAPTAADADGFPVHLVTGRLLAHYQSGAQTRRVPELVRSAGGVRLELHPLLAEALDVEDGEDVRITTAWGTASIPASVSPDIRYDTVFWPFHYSGADSVNRLVGDEVDPVSGMPRFKVTPARVARAGVPAGLPAGLPVGVDTGQTR